MPSACDRHGGLRIFTACDGCPLCCCKHPEHAGTWKPYGCPDCGAGRIAEESA